MEETYSAMLQVEQKVRAQVAGIPEHQLTWRPSPNGWSIQEVVGHLADTDWFYWTHKIAALVHEDMATPARTFDQDAMVRLRKHNERTFAQVLADLVSSRRSLVGIFRAVPEEAWAHRGQWQSGWRALNTLPGSCVLHDDKHMAQIQRLTTELKGKGGL